MKSRRAYGGERGGRGHGEHSQNEMEGRESGELKEKACRSLKRKEKASTIKDVSPTAGTEAEKRGLPE